MGAWGYRPFENDSALDWLGRIERSVAVEIHRGLTLLDSPHEAVAAAQLLLDCTSEGSRICLDYDGMNWYGRRTCKIRPASKSLFDIAIAKMDVLWKSSWPDEWNIPADCRKVVGGIRRSLARRQQILIKQAEARSARIKFVRDNSGKRRKKAA